jgi:Transposase DDE domain
MERDALPDEWEIIRGWLPSDLDARARKHGFFQRTRGLTDAERWLRLILMHVAGGLSLEQTVLRARELGLAQISAVALFKRLRKAEPWLRNLCQELLTEQQKRLGRCLWPSQYQVRAIDATDVQEPGSTGTDWRIHYSLRLPELICDHYELTDQSEGEKLGRFDFHPNELILVDRGYSHWAGVAKVLDSGAALLLRWTPKVMPVLDHKGKPFALLDRLRPLRTGYAAEWKVKFKYNGKFYHLRLCAIRKNRLAAERARQKVLLKAKCNKCEAGAESIELARYVLVLSSLPVQFTVNQVLQLYRCRWQVELAFKRLKSLLAAGHVPKSNDQSASAWMQAKILTALLLERLLLEAKIFSPWGYILPDDQPMAASD